MTNGNNPAREAIKILGEGVVNDVLRHRFMLSYEANAEGMSSYQVIKEIVKRVAVA